MVKMFNGHYAVNLFFILYLLLCHLTFQPLKNIQ